MLKQRVITASVLALVFLGVLFLSSHLAFGLLIGLVFTIGAWEWANLSGISSKFKKGIYASFVALVALAIQWWSSWMADRELLQGVFAAACAWWAISLLWIQGFPSSAVIWGAPVVRLVMGCFVLIPAWMASLYLRHEPEGAWLVLSCVLLVATADIGAYFTGRAFGKRKLAPNVSPGKSWEGVWGGALMALLIALIANIFLGNNWLMLLCVVVPTALVSVVGDLLESMVKRHRGVKDSSHILPGHGGILDRIDGLTAAAPVFAFALMATQWQG